MKKISITGLVLIVAMCTGLTFNQVKSQTTVPAAVSTTAAQNRTIQYTKAGALDVVANPYKYLKKNIQIVGKFDKFSTLGLDYPPAMRSSEKYISFLIQRPDTLSHDIPLSELKIFLKKEVAEKHIDLDAGDIIEFNGRIFSTALGDAWMDVDSFKVLTKVNPPKKEEKELE